MSLIQILKRTLLIMLVGLLPHETLLAVTQWVEGSVQTTPTKYQVNIRRVSFRNLAGQWVTYIDQLFPMDIASKDPGAAIGTLGKGLNIPPGTYNAMRFHVGSTFTINASVSDVGNGLAAYTDGGTTTTAVSNFGNMFRAAVTNGTPTPTDQILQMPISSEAQSEMGSQGMSFETIDGETYMLAVMPFDNFPFTISPTRRKMPVIQMNFDVTNAVDFVLVEDSGEDSIVAVMPAGPGLALYVNGSLAFSMGR